MKKLFMAVIALMMTISASAQFYIYCSDGNVIKVDSISMVAPESTAGIGGFSVSAHHQVFFSPGNLQYHPANNEWRFAENQTDYIGDANSNISSSYNGWIDLFGWGTGANPTNASTNAEDYQTFVDWGTNQIGSDDPKTWRTLTKDEWNYIFFIRPNAQNLFALGSVNGVNGTIILPDDWTTPTGVHFVPSTASGLLKASWFDGYYNDYNNNFSHNIYTSEQWSKMEQAGAVFLPASGYRRGTNVSKVGKFGGYWSSTGYREDGTYDPHLATFDSKYFSPVGHDFRGSSQAVRLVGNLRIVKH